MPRARLRARLCRGPAIAVVSLQPLAVVARAHLLDPLRALYVPAHRLCQASLERLSRSPAELALNLARVDRVTQVVARTVLDVRDELRELGGFHARLARDRSA